MEGKLDKFVSLDASHNAGYFETNDSDLELSEGEGGSDLGEEGREEAEKLKSKSEQFERDMNDELECFIGDMDYPVPLLKHLQGADTGDKESGTGRCEKDSHLGFYDNYFDSDEDDATEEGEKKRVLTNDELLYDPTADEKDEQWVNSQRLAYRNLTKQSTSTNNESTTEAMPQSDAILSCPGCMISLCIDCQQHESYKNQFRAMFVMNCRVERGETLKYKNKAKRRQRREVGVGGDNVVEFDVYNPVKCAGCDTEVAVYDSDEVYHFYNVLPSEP